MRAAPSKSAAGSNWYRWNRSSRRRRSVSRASVRAPASTSMITGSGTAIGASAAIRSLRRRSTVLPADRSYSTQAEVSARITLLPAEVYLPAAHRSRGRRAWPGLPPGSWAVRPGAGGRARRLRSGCPPENRSRVAPAKLSERGQYRQPHREDVAGRHGPGSGEFLQRVAAVTLDAPQHFVITRLLAAVLRGQGADERVGGHLGVHAGDGGVQHGQQHAEDVGERVLPHRRPDRVHQRARAEQEHRPVLF